MPRDELFRQVAALYERRIPVAIHCNGDVSIDDGLDAIYAAMDVHPWPDARPLIIHAQMARRDQIDRMAALGVTPIFFRPIRTTGEIVMLPYSWVLRGLPT